MKNFRIHLVCIVKNGRNTASALTASDDREGHAGLPRQICRTRHLPEGNQGHASAS